MDTREPITEPANYINNLLLLPCWWLQGAATTPGIYRSIIIIILTIIMDNVPVL